MLSAPPDYDAYYALKSGEIRGPYTLEELRIALGKAELQATDFVQRDGYPIWQPLAVVLGENAHSLEGAVAPAWQDLLVWAWRRIRYHMDEQAGAAGAAFLGLGLLALFLSRWPAIFWLPCFGAAAVTAITLLHRRRAFAGIAVLLGAVFLPLGCLIFMGAFARPRAEPSVLAVSEAAPRPVEAPRHAALPAPAPAAVPSAPLPRPSLAALVASLEPAAAPTAPGDVKLPETAAPVARAAELEAPPPLPPAEPASPSPAAVAVASEPPGFFHRVVSMFSPSAPEIPPPVSPPVASFAAARPAASTPNPAQAEGAASTAFVQEHGDALAVVHGREGSGSSFVCRLGGQTYLFTNIHVVADITQPQFTRLDGSAIAPGAAGAAAGYDIMRFGIAQPPAHPLEAMTEFAKNVALNDDVIVLGNSGGGGVVTSLSGKVVGIGPDRLEVSAEFIPGNSGSPIIHVKTGKVIGVATYLTRRYDEFARSGGGQSSAASATGAMVVRRFAYRLDNVRAWEPVNWTEFRQEAEQMRQISLLTEDIFDFIGALRSRGTPQFETSALRRAATEWNDAIHAKHVSEVDRKKATESFLGSLSSLVRGDVAAADSRLRFSYFREELRDEREVRDKLYRAFNSDAQRLATPVDRSY